MDKKEFKKAETEIIVFENNEDVVTASFDSFDASGEPVSGFEP